MDGIKLIERGVQTPRQFGMFFAPIATALRPLYWYSGHWQSSPFVALIYEDGGEERLDRVRIRIPPDESMGVALHAPGALPDLAPFLYDDDIALVGFRCEHHEEAIAVAVQLSSLDGHLFYDTIERVGEMCFFNVDGAWWELYAKDVTLLERVTSHVRQLPTDVAIERVMLARRDDQFQQS
jgi:hypothetical protein